MEVISSSALPSIIPAASLILSRHQRQLTAVNIAAGGGKFGLGACIFGMMKPLKAKLMVTGAIERIIQADSGE